MKRAATLLGIAATALSLNATTQDFAPRFAAAEMLPSFASASIASPDSQKPEPTTAWVFALGFLGLVVLRRTRSGPLS